MKIGVVGANGFVGRSLCEKFISKGLDVVAFYNRDSSLIPEKCQKYSVSEILSVLDINVLIVFQFKFFYFCNMRLPHYFYGCFRI